MSNGRKARVVAEWVQGFTAARKAAQYELVDIADFKLPLLDEVERWAKAMRSVRA